MKKLLYTFILAVCCSCTDCFDRVTINTDKFIVTGVEKVSQYDICPQDMPKQYRVMVDAHLSGIGSQVCFFTDELHHVGDTLCISKLN